MINTAKLRSALFALMFALILMPQSADARRFRIFGIPGFGGGRSETIDPVYDLPDEEPFIREGQPYDIGYLHGFSGNGYVLYRGSRYSRLDEKGIALLTEYLGFNPTAKDAAERAPNIAKEDAATKAEAAHKAALIAEGRLLERREGETSEEYKVRKEAFLAKVKARSSHVQGSSMPAKSSSGSGSFGFWTIIFLLAGVITFGKKFFAAIASAKSQPTIPSEYYDQPTPKADQDQALQSFDERIAARIAELRSQEHQPAPQTHGATSPRPAMGGFGRKGLTSNGGLG